MRWFVLAILALSLLGSIGISITALFVTKNLISLSISTPFLLAIRPMVQYLFPMDSETTQKK